MVRVLRREPSRFFRRAQRDHRLARSTVAPQLPLGTLVRVPDRGDVFIRYAPGPAGAPTVLLLHGWTASADLNWLGVFPALAGQCNVLAVDHRGHGRGIRSIDPFTLEDCADDAAGVLRELGVRHAIAVGYSMGGPIALLLARRHPERVRGIVLAASSAEIGRTGIERGMGVAMPLLAPLLRIGLPDGVARAVIDRGAPTRLGPTAELAPWMLGEMKRLHPGDAVAAGRTIAAFDARPWLHELATPVASVVTTRDRAVRPAKQRATAAALGASEIELDAGHLVCVTNPDVFGAAISEAVGVIAEARRGRWFGRATERWLRSVNPPAAAAS